MYKRLLVAIKRGRENEKHGITARGRPRQGAYETSLVTHMGKSIQSAPCGHQSNPSNVNSMVNTCLDRNSLEFSCPVCRKAWEWRQVKGLMEISQAQMAVLEGRVHQIVESHPDVYKKCPSCCCVLKRPQDSAGQPCLSVQCPQCPPPRQLCWACLSPWLFPNEAGAGHCSNGSCELVAMLLNCDIVTDPKSKVYGYPLFRACPKCHCLIMHTGHCKYVRCAECEHRFCFICLEQASQCSQAKELYFSLFCKKEIADRQRFEAAVTKQ